MGELSMRLIHQQWQLVGNVLIVDDEGNAVVVGKNAEGQEGKLAAIVINIPRFRGNEVEKAFNEARKGCAELLAKHEAQHSSERQAVLEAAKQLEQSSVTGPPSSVDS